MSRRTPLLLLILSVVLGATASSALAQASPRKLESAGSLAGKTVVPGEVIVRFKAGASANARAQVRSGANARFKEALLLDDTEVVVVRAGNEGAAAAALSRNPNVVYAEPNGVVHATATPNDTRFGSLYGLHNTGQVISGQAGIADSDIDAIEGWNMGRALGSSVRVADIDSGVARTHPDLSLNMFTNPGESGGGKETNGIDDDANGRVDDFRGWDFINNDNDPADDNDHGTHVAGTIAGRANNGQGVAGVAAFPQLLLASQWAGPKIVAIKVLDEDGSGTFSAIANGIAYAGHATINAKVANMSLGGAGTSATLDNAIKSRPSTLYVIAAGNGGSDGVGDDNDVTPSTPCNPATTPDAANKICVAATDNRDQLAGFSNFGDVNVDLGAPGVQVLSSLPHRISFTENFEVALTGRWVTNDAGQTGVPRWARTTAFATSGTNSIEDSPGGDYVDNQSNWARTANGLNLTGCTPAKVTAQVRLDTEFGYDYLRVEATKTPAVAGSWQQAAAYHGTGEGTIEAQLPAAFSNQTGVYIRFRLTSDGSFTHDGAHVDDVKVKCYSSYDANSYAFFNGTSMATPHVAGAATFLATKFPTATVAQTKDRIMRGVDPKASLAGKTVTGGRLNLYKSAAESTASISGGILRITAGVGQTNNYVISRVVVGSTPFYQVTDNYATLGGLQGGSRFVPGAGCARINNTMVRCSTTGVTRISVVASDLNDSVNAGTILIPLTVDGGSGNDTITTGAAADTLIGQTGADRFTSGGGSDTINARNEDVDALFSCGETAGDNDTVNADLSPNDPITASAANCEVVNKL